MRALTEAQRELVGSPETLEFVKKRAYSFYRKWFLHVDFDTVYGEALVIACYVARSYKPERGPWRNYLSRALARRMYQCYLSKVITGLRDGFHLKRRPLPLAKTINTLSGDGKVKGGFVVRRDLSAPARKQFEDRQYLEKLLARVHLDERDWQALEIWCDKFHGTNHTFAGLGAKWGQSKEAPRQRAKAALIRLRRAARGL